MVQLKTFSRESLFIYFSLLCTCLLNTLSIQGQGLFFKGNEYLIDERTSYNVFSHTIPVFKDSLCMSFDFSADNRSNTGYIFRIKTQNSNLTFNLSYFSEGRDITYKLNEEGKSTLITLLQKKQDARPGVWHPIQLKLDLSKQMIYFSVGNVQDSSSIKLPQTLQPEVFFGKSDYFIDLPTFSIRNLRFRDKGERYTFRFKEHDDNAVHDQSGAQMGTVANPTWLINKTYYWSPVASFSSKATASFNFDTIAHNIYYYNRDSITTYDVVNKRTNIETYSNESPIHPSLGYNFIDAKNQTLYSYEAVTSTIGDVTVAKYDIQDKLWTAISTDVLPKQLHHHGKFFDEENNRFIIFGGFGHMYYHNQFNSYNLATNSWEQLEFTGDTIFPRYFLSMGYHKSNNCLYIFGGMGNESGEYNVGRKYFYDLYKVDLNEMHITKLWEIPWEKDHIVPVKSMLVYDDSFMTLCYPEHFSNTHLKLYRFSMLDGSYEILGDSIPIRSEKITTNADLFYSREMGELYGVVQEFENDDIASTLNIYSLSTPAISYNELFLANKSKTKGFSVFYWIIAAAGIIVLYSIGRKLLKKKKEKDIPTSAAVKLNELEKVDKTEKKNAIFIFGDFTVYNKKGKDISYMFSTRLKQTFLLLLEHSLEDGISTQRLTSILWSDRDDEKAKNIRGVTISSLRKLFDEMEGISLVYEKSHYKILIEDNLHCDYTKCIQLIKHLSNETERSMFVDIISRGKLMKDDEDPIYDSLKSSLERKVEPVVKQLIEDNYRNNNLETVISLSEAMFNIDPISDYAISYLANAMEKLNMVSEARKRFFKFIVEYKKMLGEEYPKDYSEVIKNENIN